MKFLSIPLFLIFLTSFSSPFGNTPSEDDAVGLWLSENGKEKVRIDRRGDRYFGTMVWMENEYDAEGNQLKDIHNPDPELKDRPHVGIEFLKDFKYVGNGWYTGGEIYDMGSGSSYSARIYMPDKQTAKIRGYIGIPLFGRTEICTKIE